MHTKVATVASACYMADAENEVTESDVSNLYKQAQAWGVLPDVEQAFLKIGVHNELKKQASAATTYALDEEYDGQQVQRFPVDTPELVKISADRFYADRDKYPYAWRQKVAQTLHENITKFKIASWFNDNEKAYLEKAAGYGLGSTECLWRELGRRQVLGKWQPGLAKVAEAVETIAEASPEGMVTPELTKLACQVFATFDASAQLADMVGLPEESLIKDELTLTKVAAEHGHFVKLADGVTVDIRNLTADKLEAVNPKLAGMSQEELKEILPTLPADMAEVLTQVA